MPTTSTLDDVIASTQEQYAEAARSGDDYHRRMLAGTLTVLLRLRAGLRADGKPMDDDPLPSWAA